ncbi:hypothetical protein ACLIYP_02020 [Streptomyces nanhaiensis]|uniref:hypothetical protein n=1 Tax=Streptomyces nanhaiensis TaxID=679319 RepID=UPI00399D4084
MSDRLDDGAEPLHALDDEAKAPRRRLPVSLLPGRLPDLSFVGALSSAVVSAGFRLPARPTASPPGRVGET